MDKDPFDSAGFELLVNHDYNEDSEVCSRCAFFIERSKKCIACGPFHSDVEPHGTCDRFEVTF
jgi:hypothetical protein